MGNHEYCEDCGANDFHLGRPCDPVKKARVDAERQERAARRDAGVAKLRELHAELVGRGIRCEIDTQTDYLEIPWWAFEPAPPPLPDHYDAEGWG